MYIHVVLQPVLVMYCSNDMCPATVYPPMARHHWQCIACVCIAKSEVQSQNCKVRVVHDMSNADKHNH